MAERSSIEWTDATWNPITGCSVVSPGCTNCYAMRLAGTRLRNSPSRAGLTRDSKAGAVWTGEVRFNETKLTEPLRWRRPRMIFVCAHGDLFHESVPDELVDQVFAVMALATHHTFQVPTKRAARMRAYFGSSDTENRVGHAVMKIAPVGRDIRSATLSWTPRVGHDFNGRWPLPNVWLGVSAEDQRRADERVPDLLATPAAIRFVSAEPLLGPIDLLWALGHRMEIAAGFLKRGQFSPGLETLRPLDWIIAGGESGPGARPMHPAWVREIRDQCVIADIPFHFKQRGAWSWLQPSDGEWPTDADGFIRLNEAGQRTDDGWPMQRVGKKHAGRLLDGVEHNGMPESAHA